MICEVGVKVGGTNLSVVCRTARITSVIGEDELSTSIPSVIATTNSGRTVFGTRAQQQMWVDRERTARPLLRFWERQPDSPSVGKHPRSPSLKYPEEATLLFRELRRLIEIHEGEKAPALVACCPSFFEEAERQALMNALREADWNCMRILSEPTAALWGLKLHQFGTEQLTRVLVVKVGGSTTTSAVLNYDTDYQIWEYDSQAHDRRLGGEDITHCIIDYMCEQFKNEHAVDPREDSHCMQRLFDAAENAKVTLSTASETTIWLPRTARTRTGWQDIQLVLTRGQLEELSAHIHNRIGQLIEKSLDEADLAPDDLDHVLLIGGSSNAPSMRSTVSHYAGQPLLMARYPDSLAAHGALIVAGTIINRPLCGMVYLDPKELPASASEKPVEDSAEKLTMEEEDPETDHW